MTAKIRAIGGRRTAIPPVVVTLLDEHGASVYEWSVSAAGAGCGAGARWWICPPNSRRRPRARANCA